MTNLTKQELNDEAFAYYQHLTQNWLSASGESLSEYLNRVENGNGYIQDFVNFLIERNFKR